MGGEGDGASSLMDTGRASTRRALSWRVGDHRRESGKQLKGGGRKSVADTVGSGKETQGVGRDGRPGQPVLVLLQRALGRGTGWERVWLFVFV